MLTDIFIHTGDAHTHRHAHRQAGRHRCVPLTVQLTHRFAYICVSCNSSNNKACLQLSAQCSSCINCKPVSVRVCVCVCPCQLHNLSCCSACCLACCPLTGPNIKWSPPAVCAKALEIWFLHTKLLPTSRSSSGHLYLSHSVVPCWLSYMCGICFYSLEHKILWRWKPERMLLQTKQAEARGVFRPNAKYPREMTNWHTSISVYCG